MERDRLRKRGWRERAFCLFLSMVLLDIAHPLWMTVVIFRAERYWKRKSNFCVYGAFDMVSRSVSSRIFVKREQTTSNTLATYLYMYSSPVGKRTLFRVLLSMHWAVVCTSWLLEPLCMCMTSYGPRNIEHFGIATYCSYCCISKIQHKK